MKLGKTNKLIVARTTDNGAYLTDTDGNEVLLPNAYVADDTNIGDEVEVFVYNDSEDRLVATTLSPYIQLDEFAYLKVKEVNDFGAFLDWGLPKDLLVPFAEQNAKMKEGNSYVVFLLKDEETDRLIGSAKVKEFLFFDEIDVREGDEVDLLLYDMNELGMDAIVNNMYKGLVFKSDIHKTITEGDRLKGYVKQVREDGKIDIVLDPPGYKKSIDKFSQALLDALQENKGTLNLSDKSTPDEINAVLGMSKKAFKKALGKLYKQKLVVLGDQDIRLS